MASLVTMFNLISLEGTLKALSLGGKIVETTESIVNSLIVRLVRRMCKGPQGDGKAFVLYGTMDVL